MVQTAITWHWIGAVTAQALLAAPATALQAPRPAERPADYRTVREGMLAADWKLSDAVLRDGLPKALAAALGADALFLFERAPIVAGARSAVTLLDAALELGRLRVEWLPLVAHVSPDGSLGVTYGVTLATDKALGDSAVTRASKYISVWRRRGEQWTLAAHVQTRLVTGSQPTLPAVASPKPTPWQRTDGSAARFVAADLAFARLAGDSGAPAAFAAFAAPTGVVFAAGGDLLVGPEAIKSRMQENPNRTQWSWAPRFAGASDDGEMGFTVGEATIRVIGGDSTSTFYSKYLTVWRRMPDGSVRFLVDGGNARPAPAGSAP